MKRFLLFTLVLAVAWQPAEGDDFSIESLKEVLNHASLSEDGGVRIRQSSGLRYRRPTQEEVDVLMAGVKNWRTIFTEEIDQIAPDYRQQKVLLRSCEFLQPDEYLELQLRLLELAEKGKLENKPVIDSVWGHVEKQGFLAYNYEDSRVQLILERAINLVEPGDSNLELLRRAKAGDLVKQVVFARRNSGRPLPESLGKANREAGVAGLDSRAGKALPQKGSRGGGMRDGSLAESFPYLLLGLALICGALLIRATTLKNREKKNGSE